MGQRGSVCLYSAYLGTTMLFAFALHATSNFSDGTALPTLKFSLEQIAKVGFTSC
jgi:hypothetical protein